MTGDTRETMTASIVAAYRAATPASIVAGRDWYPTAGRIVATLAEWSGSDPAATAAVLATLSPRNPWTWNVQDCAAVMHAAGTGGTVPRVTTFGANRAKAWAIATGAADPRAQGPKVSAFVAAIMGDREAVVVDVWAMRVATRGRMDSVPGGASYQLVAGAYRDASAIVGEHPRELQAIVWTAALDKRTAHGWTLKRGTFAVVSEALGILTLGL